MIVVGRKRSSIVCLPLFKHLGIKGNELPFFQARVPVYAKGKPAPSYPTTCPCESLKIALEHGRELSNDVWINVGEPQTIRLEEVEVALHGSMCEGDFKKLRGAYLDSQDFISKAQSMISLMPPSSVVGTGPGTRRVNVNSSVDRARSADASDGVKV